MPPRLRIIAFPHAGNIYTERLYQEVAARGVEVIEGVWSCRWLLRNVRRGGVVHIHWPSFLYFEPSSRLRTGVRLGKLALGLALIKRRGAAVIWTAHNLYPHEGGRDLLAHRLGRAITLAFADRVLVHGLSAATIVEREFGVPRSRLRIGHHPHWIDSYPNRVTALQARALLHIDPDEFLYLHIGRCKPYKGLEALIEAFREAPQPSRLLIAGNFSSAPYQEDIQALSRLTPNVQIVPRSIPDDELQLYLNAADCVVLPYRAVLTSGTALLALSFGRPVIAPDLGSMRDHVDVDSGILYDPEEPNALARALRDIRTRIFNPDAIVARARCFTWSDMADLLLDIDAPI